jgi:hypothetical protein
MLYGWGTDRITNAAYIFNMKTVCLKNVCENLDIFSIHTYVLEWDSKNYMSPTVRRVVKTNCELQKVNRITFMVFILVQKTI